MKRSGQSSQPHPQSAIKPSIIVSAWCGDVNVPADEINSTFGALPSAADNLPLCPPPLNVGQAWWLPRAPTAVSEGLYLMKDSRKT
jgi:hypothetical protein